MDVRRIYKEELKNRLSSPESNIFGNSYSKIMVNDKPPRRSYERFIRDETPESVINFLADFVLDQGEGEQVSYDLRNEGMKVETGTIGSVEDFGQENIDVNLAPKSRRTTESAVMSYRKEVENYFNTSKLMAQGNFRNFILR